MPNAPDGTVIRMQDGSLRVKRGAQWLPTGNMYVGPGPKLEPQDRKALAEARQGAERAGSAMLDLDRFQALNRKQGSGGLLGLPVVRDLHGLVNPEVGEMNSITKRLTPQEREPGSGPMSDKDVEMYGASVPGQRYLGPTNAKLAGRRRAGAIRHREYAAFQDYFARVNGTLNGAQEMWDEYKVAEPVYDPQSGTVRQARGWREYFGVSAPARGGGGRQAAPGAPAPRTARQAPVAGPDKMSDDDLRAEFGR